MNPSRRVFSSMDWGMLRQAQHDEMNSLLHRTEINSAQALKPVQHIIRVRNFFYDSWFK